MRKILLISTRVFWPADSGHKVVLWNYCKGLAEQLDYEVHVWTFLEGGQDMDEATRSKPSFIANVGYASSVPRGEKAANLIGALPNGSMPFQCCLFQSVANSKALAAHVESLDPDVILVDMIRLAPYLDAVGAHRSAKVIYYEDLLSKRYFRQVGETGGNALGNYGKQASALLSQVANGPLKDTVFKVEARRCERAEDGWARRVDATLFISPLEAHELGERAGVTNCFSATMGAEVTDIVDPGGPKAYDLGFVGNLYTAANQDSLCCLIGEVLPLLPGRTLCVVGVCPDEVRVAYAGNDRVTFTGRVESIADALGSCSLLLAPFVYGTGVKTKVLEAMGMGVPVVTNPLGLEGIAAERGREVLCADTSRGLADAALSLLKDERLRRSVARAGQDYVRRNHDWTKSIADLGECLDCALDAASRRAGGGAR
ncbi:glycosyltransferase family 4 protein [Paratractidigestivibacter sp.]|uniref:glycosyltransferase family 4 protein n=1 Tax=Paratractidigestivibacter sp. TaxID=2847316 RepID=UPI002ACB09EE|nr:glycosyltransferase family 4 protein [Paratractidigestivibacter sp.]